jgi:pyruvate,water dikinase
MASIARTEPDLKALLLDTPAEDGMEALRQSRFASFYACVVQYVDRYGFRCMSEMKLEQPDLHQDSTFLFTCLKNYLRSDSVDLETYSQREQQVRTDAELKVKRELIGWRKLIYLWSLKHARKAVRNRENTRFCRSRIYGVVRAMFCGIGRDYSMRRIIDRPRDIFYLTLDELRGSLEGHLTSQNLRNVVQQRKQEYGAYEDIEPAPRFITRGPPYWMNCYSSPDGKPPDDDRVAASDKGNRMQGTGCCPGLVEGVVKVILSPDDDMELNGEILCTMRTDPGWIPLYPSVSGLLVERGGLLSHSAIVAREMGLPTVVGIKDLTKIIQSGMRVRLDGKTGEIEIVERNADRDTEGSEPPVSS